MAPILCRHQHGLSLIISTVCWSTRNVRPPDKYAKPRFRPTVKTRELVYRWLRSPKGEAASYAAYLAPQAKPPAAGKGRGPALSEALCGVSRPKRKGRASMQSIFPEPSNHTDAAQMSKRPDDTLFDGIHVGGFVLNKSHRMPGFGATLTREQLRSLVKHVRTLVNVNSQIGQGRALRLCPLALQPLYCCHAVHRGPGAADAGATKDVGRAARKSPPAGSPPPIARPAVLTADGLPGAGPGSRS